MSEHAKRKNARKVLSRAGYASGGHLSPTISDGIKRAIHEHEGHMHPDAKPTRLKLKSGGCAEGYAPGGRLDKAPRKGKGATKVNVIVAPQGGPPMGAGAHPPMAGPSMGAPPMAPPAAMPHPMAPPQAGGMPGGPPPGGMPGVPQLPQKPPGLKKGGRAAPKMTGGAGNGVGRLEKTEAEERRTTPEKDG